MVLSPDDVIQAGHVIFVVAGIAINFTASYFSARSRADKHAVEYSKAKAASKVWEFLDKELSRVENGCDVEANGVKAAFADLRASFLDYGNEVEKWHRRVGSDFSDVTDDQYRQQENSDDRSVVSEGDEQGKSRKKRIAPISRATYVLLGERKIYRYAKRYEKKETRLFARLAALSLVFRGIDIPKIPPAPGGVPALIRFIAKAKQRIEMNAEIPIIQGVDVFKYHMSKTIIDSNTAFTRLSELAIKRGDLQLRAEYGKEPGLQSYEDCIVVRRSGGDLKESLDLARLFAEDPTDKFSRGFFTDPPDGAMLRCRAVLVRNAECDLFFRIPEGCSLQTLRQLLPKSRRSHAFVSKGDRVKFSIRLATSVLVVHSLGLVHKRIHPETILVAQKQLYLDENPRRLGFPYLAAFQGARSDVGISLKKSDVEGYKLRGIYFHPRDQCVSEYRAERYTMEDDIYSLGVCLFEIALWRSLLVWDEEISDYVYDDSFIPLSDRHPWHGITMKERARAKLKLLVEKTRTHVRKALGKTFADVVESCLTVGYDSNPFRDQYETFRDENSDDPVAWKYLQLVLSKLHGIHESYRK